MSEAVRAGGGTGAAGDAAPAPEPEPEPVLTVRMCNAHYGARKPGDLVTLGEPLARALIREGLAEQVRR